MAGLSSSTGSILSACLFDFHIHLFDCAGTLVAHEIFVSITACGIFFIFRVEDNCFTDLCGLLPYISVKQPQVWEVRVRGRGHVGSLLTAEWNF